ncbi:hypothetical protein T484DRAFT_1752059 [Baffinella frigidus]|nr:hypothetical protein T484DRAFT_1752059 [Cryptophyta sp. CCMP2293]
MADTGGACWLLGLVAGRWLTLGGPAGRSYLDSASCAHVNGTRGYCVAHACAVQTVDVRLAFIRDFRLTIDAPKGFQYTFMYSPAAALSCQLPPYPDNCRPILPTAALSCQPPPYPANRRNIMKTQKKKKWTALRSEV